MKKNKKIIKTLLVFTLVLSLTGCTKYVKMDKKVVQNETTGQNLVENILCKPTDKKILEAYNKYNESISNQTKKINIDSLEDCSSLKIFGGEYNGLWATLFVKPLAVLIIKIGELVKSYGLALILATILIRLVVFPFTKKTAMQSEKLKKAKPELDRLEKKYAGKVDQESMMKKSQEMMMIYKTYDIKPLAGCLFAFIQIPLFFAFYEAIGRIPVIFEETFYGFQLGTSPMVGITSGNFQYLILIVLIPLATYYSFKLNSTAAMSSEQEASMKKMSTFMVVLMTITSLTISSGIGIYWITSNIFTIIQNLLVKKEN